MTSADSIFDAVWKYNEKQIHVSNIAAKLHQIEDTKKKVCGNCDYWMKSTCVPEKEWKQFKSMSSLACKDFEFDWYSKERLIVLEDELTVLRSKK